MAQQGAIVITAQVRDTQQARRELEGLAKTTDQVGRQTVAANQAMAVSSRELAHDTMQLRTAQTELRSEFVRTSGEVVRVAGDLVEWGAAAAIAHRHNNTLIAGTRILTAAMGPLGVAIGATVFALKHAGDAMEYLQEQAIPAAATAESSMTSLRIVTERTGNSFGEAKQLLSEYDDALSSRSAVAQAVRTFNTMGVSMERQRELIDAMRDGIVAMGGDVNTQLPLMALAIKRQEGELLDNMGVVSTVEQMYKNYAATLGTTADKLNQARREEAVMQGVLAETGRLAGSAAASMDTYQGKVNALATEQRKLAEEIGATVEPLASLVVQLERGVVALQRWSWKNVVTRPSDEDLQKLPFGIPNPMQPWIDAKSAQDAATDAERKYGMAIARRADELWKSREGGFGPLFPNRMGEDLSKFYDNVAAETARRDEEARRKREQVANEQKALEQSLFKDLATVGKQGWDLLIAQEGLAYAERIQKAHGNRRLLEDAEKLHVERIKEIRQKLGGQYASPIGPGLSNSPSQYDFAIGPGLNDGIDYEGVLEARKRAEDVGERIDRETAAYLKKIRDIEEEGRKAIRDGLSSGIQAGLDGGIPGLTSSFETASKNALTKGIVTAIESSPAFGAMGQLGAAFANPFVAAFGVAFSAGIQQFMQERQQWETLQDRYITKESERPQWQRDLDSANQQRAGIETRLGQLDAIIKEERTNFIDRQNAESERNQLLRQLGETDKLTAAIQHEAADEQRKAAEDQRKAAEDQRRAADRAWDALRGAAGTVDDTTREMGWEKRLADARGTSSEEAVKAQVEKERGIHRRVGTLEDSIAAIAEGTKGVVPWADGEVPQWLIGQFSGMAQKYAEDGQFTDEERNALYATYGEDNLFTHAMNAGLGDSLLQAIQNLADGISLENNRVLPGSSPQKPAYNVIVNFKDLWASMPASGWHQATGPGTRRDDGGDRGVGGR
ncbi:hypothetical protein D3C87_655920 [compost metagenome]